MRRLLSLHPRKWRKFHYVYPVISRRSRGLSVGVNLNPDKACNFDCVYCCVDRSGPRPEGHVDLERLWEELEQVLEMARTGEIWEDASLGGVDPAYRRLSDVAFSGDGEPTLCPVFDQAIRVALEVRREQGLTEVPLILITNASMLDRRYVQNGLELLDAGGGRVWAKLDAGDEASFRDINRPRVAFERVLDNILTCGRRRAITIQTMLLRHHGQPLTSEEFDAYAQRLADLLDRGCRIRDVQLYTVARQPQAHDAAVLPLSDVQIDRLAQRLRDQLHGRAQIEVYYAPAS